MSDCEYLTFSPHCDCNLPAMTFRNHRERFFNPANNIWQKKLDDVDDEFDELLMEIPMDTPSEGEDGDLFNTVEP